MPLHFPPMTPLLLLTFSCLLSLPRSLFVLVFLVRPLLLLFSSSSLPRSFFDSRSKISSQLLVLRSDSVRINVDRSPAKRRFQRAHTRPSKPHSRATSLRPKRQPFAFEKKQLHFFFWRENAKVWISVDPLRIPRARISRAIFKGVACGNAPFQRCHCVRVLLRFLLSESARISA